jgi:hypothetical protein
MEMVWSVWQKKRKKKLNVELLYDLATPILGMFPYRKELT